MELAQRPQRRLHSLSIAVCACLALLTPSREAMAGEHPHDRAGWFVGLGFGGGSAALTSGGESSDREGGAAGSFRGGYAFNQKLALGLESNMWFKTEDNVDFTLSTYAVALSFFPSEGLVLRAGIGGGDAEAETQSGSTTLTATESGFGATVGIAYEFRVLRSFAIGPQLDFAYVNVDSFDANYINAGMLLTWYFIPR